MNNAARIGPAVCLFAYGGECSQHRFSASIIIKSLNQGRDAGEEGGVLRHSQTQRVVINAEEDTGRISSKNSKRITRRRCRVIGGQSACINV